MTKDTDHITSQINTQHSTAAQEEKREAGKRGRREEREAHHILTVSSVLNELLLFDLGAHISFPYWLLRKEYIAVQQVNQMPQIAFVYICKTKDMHPKGSVEI
jgi:hypothetical protein